MSRNTPPYRTASAGALVSPNFHDGDEFMYFDDETGEVQLLGRAVGGPFGFVPDGAGGWREWSVESDTDAAPTWAEN